MDSQKNYSLDPQNPQIIFILGGPGSGKGTQCERLVRDYHFEHISVGEVIRESIEKDGELAAKLKELVEKGNLVPDTIVVDCLEASIKGRKAQKYLIDGFPRNIDQAKLFEAQIKEIDIIVNIECDEQVLVDRLTKRGLTGARADDNEETIKNRINVYNEKTVQVSEYYGKFGKIKHINGNQIVDKVYEEVKAAIKPNIIFFMGPPAVGKSTVSRILSEKLKYMMINLEEFSKQYQCKNQQDLSNALMQYCLTVPHNCIIIDQFFTDHAQAEVFFKHFALPQKVYYLDTPKDEVYMNISKYYTCEKKKKYQQKVYEQYVQDRVGLLKLMQGQSYFRQINAATSIEGITAQIMKDLKPLTLVAFDHYNRDLAGEYYYTMEKERGYMTCEMEELYNHENDRQTHLGRKMGSFLDAGKLPANNFIIEMIQKIMFNEPENTKFLFSNWPQSSKDFKDFEESLYPIDYLLNFQQEGQQYVYQHRNTPYLDYYSQGKVINISKNAIDILDSYTTPRSKYGFVTGPTAGGKTTIGKHIAQQFDYELVDFTNEAFLEKVKAKYIKEDDEVQEVGYKHIEQYFIERLNPSIPNQKVLLFDSFPYENELQNFISKVGLPTFLVNLRVNKDPLIKRYKEKNEMDKEAELGEEDQAKIDDILKKDADLTAVWEELAKQNFGVKLFSVNGDLPLESTKRYVNQIFQKRVFIVSDYLDYRQEGQPEFTDKSLEEIRNDQRLIFLNLAAQREMTFIDVASLLQQHYNAESKNQDIKNQYEMRWSKQGPSYPSNYTPQLTLQVIQNYLSTLKNETRDILLFNYPSADAPVEKSPNEVIFPRASDELKLIEDCLGPVRMLTVLTKERVEHSIQDPQWEMERPEKKVKPAGEGAEGEGEGEEAEKEAEEGEEEEGKPKFDIYNFTWTQSDGLPKTLPQWFNKTRKTLKKHYSLQQGSEMAFDQLQTYIDLINEENEQNKEEQDYRKVNVFVQLRYDNVEEEDEIDPPEPESEPEDANQGDEDDEEEKPQQEGEQQEGENQEGADGQEEAQE